MKLFRGGESNSFKIPTFMINIKIIEIFMPDDLK